MAQREIVITPEITERRKAWARRLRDDRYEQAQGTLQLFEGYDENGEAISGGFCCLGVLCDEYLAQTGEGEWIVDQRVEPGESCLKQWFFVLPDGTREASSLPGKVAEWAGLTINGDLVGVHNDDPDDLESDSTIDSLVQANDDYNWTFGEIADLVTREDNPLVPPIVEVDDDEEKQV